MTFYSVFVNLRKKCAGDCSIITYLDEIYHNSPIAYWIDLCLALKRCGFDSSGFKYYFFFHFFFRFASFFGFILDFVHNWIHLFEFGMCLYNKYSTVNNLNKPTCE